MGSQRLNAHNWSLAVMMLAGIFVMGCGDAPRPGAEAEASAALSNGAPETSVSDDGNPDALENGSAPPESAETGPEVSLTDASPATVEHGPTPAATENGSAASDAGGSNTSLPSVASSGETKAQAKREPIYDPEADGETLIAAALERATREHKHVLIEWGGNWCGWCFKLHDVFTDNEDVRPIMFEEYELVLIDSGANHTLMEKYGGKDRRYSFPHLTVLDAQGNVLVNQNTEPLEDGPLHDPAKVAQFLRQWAPQPLDAENLLASALQRAADEDKRVLIHVGTPYCGWCRVLSQFLREHTSLFESDYIDLKIDTLRMTHGESLAARFRPGKSLGVPWMVILDSSGEVLATSVGPDGNCGYPYHPPEIDHFLSMLAATRQRMTDAGLAAIRADLERYRDERERRQREQASE